uniref:Calmodulin-like protein 4 n=1 Tax=Anthurium amnicola TaxID=1678845 RepID=A0A1D1YZW7_9ARAE
MAGATSPPSRRTSRRGRGRASGGGGDGDGMTEYEQQRLSRIRENRARLQALGLPNLASSLLGSSGSGKPGQILEEGEADTGKGKRHRKRCGENEDEEDDEYQPSDEGEGGESSSSDEEKAEEEESLVSPSGARQTPKGKGQKEKTSGGVKVRKQLSIQQRMDELDFMDDEVALQQAIAISLEEPVKYSSAETNMISQISAGVSTSTKRQGKIDGTSTQDTPGGGKRRKGNVRRPQMTEDELVAYFFSFDEAGKGSIMLHDLMKVVIAHDFSWTDKDMADMIYLFDSDGDGKLTLDDFRTIVSRCRMMREPESC